MIKKISIQFEDNDYVYEIPIKKIQPFCKPETIKDIEIAIKKAIRSM